ncbi:MAG: hypothetical protein AB8C02_09245 [Halioglobus sp.]
MSGVILLMAMVFLLVLGLGAQRLLHSSTVAMRMAGNFQENQRVRQIALSFAREVGGEVANFNRSVDVGHVQCLVASSAEGCDSFDLTAVASASQLPAGAIADVRVTRLAPQYLSALELRLPEAIASSSAAERYAVYEIEASVAGPGQDGVYRATRGVGVREPAESSVNDRF